MGVYNMSEVHSEVHRYRLKNKPMKGTHTIKRGRRKVAHINPGEIIEATPEEIGARFLFRFDDLGAVEDTKYEKKEKSAKKRGHSRDGIRSGRTEKSSEN